MLVWIAFSYRLLSIQVLSDEYQKSSANITIREKVEIPARGVIYDRNGLLLVYNDPAFDLMVVASEVKPFDTLMLSNIIDVDPEFIRECFQKILSDPYQRVNPYTIVRQIPSERIGMLQEILFRFPGFYVQERTLRRYPMRIAAHTLGYTGEVDRGVTINDPYYRPGDYIGISGIEKSYEKILRGKKGLRKILKDKFNRDQGAYLGGKEDIQALSGTDIFLSLDAELQAYGERLMENKIGSIVAIEPATGEILALVTSPGYDPNLLSGRKRTQNYRALLQNERKPLLNRALQAQYPPGSTFKVVNALIGLQMGAVEPDARFSCGGAFFLGGLTVRCHSHNSPVNLAQSIQYSCNTYYCWVFRDMIDRNSKYSSTREAYEAWRNYAATFGLGERFKNDIPYEYRGNLPTSELYDRFHGKNRWRALSIISLAIGQGEILTTPMQLANIATTIANRGYYITPHIVKAIGSVDNLNDSMMIKNETPIDKKHYEIVVKGMRDVVVAGTARNAAIENIEVCGKTGTAQNPHGENHSLFIAFAPMDNPQIAIAVVVENAGYGSTWASPIASLMIEMYLNRDVKRTAMEERIINANFIDNN